MKLSDKIIAKYGADVWDDNVYANHGDFTQDYDLSGAVIKRQWEEFNFTLVEVFFEDTNWTEIIAIKV